MTGTAGIQVPLVVYFTQTAAGAANNDYTLTRAGTVLDATIVARATQAGGTCQISRVRSAVAAAITDAMDASGDQNVSRAGTVNDANYAVIVGDAVRVITTGAATLVDALVTIVPPVSGSSSIA